MLQDHRLTRHAATRMRQRGLRDVDIMLIVTEAELVAPDTYLLTERDADDAIARRKREIQQLERLKGCKVVSVDGVIVTCCYSTDRDQTRVLRRGRQHK